MNASLLQSWVKKRKLIKESSLHGNIGTIYDVAERTESGGFHDALSLSFPSISVAVSSFSHLDGHTLAIERWLRAENPLCPDCKLDMEPLKIKSNKVKLLTEHTK